MARGHRPVKRLLVVPVLLFAGILALLHLVPVGEGPPAAGLSEVEEQVGPLADPVPDCVRDTDGVVVAPRPPPPGARVSSAMILACPPAFDGRQVTYVGELIGDLLRRDGGAWVLVNDDDYALEVGPLPSHQALRGTNSGMSVWLPEWVLDQVTGLGRPDQRGDVVALRGTVVRTDPRDGGGLTLRADELTLLAPATPIGHTVPAGKVWLAVASVSLGAGLWVLRRRSEQI